MYVLRYVIYCTTCLQNASMVADKPVKAIAEYSPVASESDASVGTVRLVTRVRRMLHYRFRVLLLIGADVERFERKCRGGRGRL
jgi:hypothetical protein